jgi:chemotaxis protein histidine kinase CheA
MLDQFMNQIGEMVLVRGQLAHIIGDQRVREGLHRLRHGQEGHLKDPQSQLADLQQVAESLDDQLRRLQETDALIQGALSRLQDSVMGLRVVPVELVFKRFPRMVRDLALAQGKQIRLELIGQEVKIDKAMVESLADPLLHMVRNSADHGVEKPEERRQAGKPDEAVIRIQAEQQGSRIMIRVIDDGKGIDPERVRRKAVDRGLVKEEDSLQMSKEDILSFIFRPAFSTADVVTETSGRGVGMDVVRTSVMRLGGTIHLDSEVGRGTTFTMQMPLSAAVQEVLLVNTANQTMAIPGRYVAELVEVSPDEYQTVKGRTAILLRGNFLPIVRLEEVLGYPPAEKQSHRYVVVLSDGCLGARVRGSPRAVHQRHPSALGRFAGCGRGQHFGRWSGGLDLGRCSLVPLGGKPADAPPLAFERLTWVVQGHMAQYLHIRVDDIDLLLPALQVHEVIGLEHQDRKADDHAIWRDQVIASCDLGQVLQRSNTAASTRHYGVVYSPNDSDALPVLMLIDEVLGLRNPKREQLHRLPGAMSTAHGLFDGIWIDSEQSLKAYCVKAQLPLDFLA